MNEKNTINSFNYIILAKNMNVKPNSTKKGKNKKKNNKTNVILTYNVHLMIHALTQPAVHHSKLQIKFSENTH